MNLIHKIINKNTLENIFTILIYFTTNMTTIHFHDQNNDFADSNCSIHIYCFKIDKQWKKSYISMIA
jgi:hypothetical protein